VVWLSKSRACEIGSDVWRTQSLRQLTPKAVDTGPAQVEKGSPVRFASA